MRLLGSFLGYRHPVLELGSIPTIKFRGISRREMRHCRFEFANHLFMAASSCHRDHRGGSIVVPLDVLNQITPVDLVDRFQRTGQRPAQSVALPPYPPSPLLRK